MEAERAQMQAIGRLELEMDPERSFGADVFG
jgi:hypothetical protein